MARPKKRQGWSTIEVDGVIYSWCFNWRGNSVLQIEAENVPGARRLVVDWGWKDWSEPLLPGETEGNEPAIVTPKFVREAIQNAIRLGWQPEEKGLRFFIEYKDSSFKIVSLTRRSGH